MEGLSQVFIEQGNSHLWQAVIIPDIQIIPKSTVFPQKLVFLGFKICHRMCVGHTRVYSKHS